MLINEIGCLWFYVIKASCNNHKSIRERDAVCVLGGSPEGSISLAQCMSLCDVQYWVLRGAVGGCKMMIGML